MKGVQAMNRQEFILTLRKELSKLPPEEIVAATEFFEECFEEATIELDEEERIKEEQRLINEFGNPKRIAAQVKADYAARLLNGDETILDKQPTVKKKLSAVWWVVIGICSAPVSIPIAIGIICVAIGLVAVIIEIYAGIIGAGVASIGGIVLGCVFLSSSAATGIMVIGGGLLGLAISAAAAVGAYIGTKALVRAIARTAKTQNAKRKRKKYAKMEQAGEKEAVWVRTDDEGFAEAEADETDEWITLELPEEPAVVTEPVAAEGEPQVEGGEVR